MELKVAVSTVIHRMRDRRMLVLRRSDNGKWNFPGGKVEPPENLEQAAAREVDEETGIKIRPTNIEMVFSNGTDDEGTFIFVLFGSTITTDPVVTINSEHTEYRWVTAQELKKEISPEALPRIGIYAMFDQAPTDGVYHRDPTEYSWYCGESKSIGKKK